MAVRYWGKASEAAARAMEDGSDGAVCGAKVCVRGLRSPSGARKRAVDILIEAMMATVGKVGVAVNRGGNVVGRGSCSCSYS